MGCSTVEKLDFFREVELLRRVEKFDFFREVELLRYGS